MNWRYALGEVALIVVGILIALAASEWQNARVERRVELRALNEMRGALSADLVGLEATLMDYRLKEGRLTSLVDHMRRGGDYADSLNSYFGAAYGFSRASLNRAAYESLKSRGLDLVSDDDLRALVAEVYEVSYTDVEASFVLERNVVLDVLRPYFLVHFRDLDFGESAVPVDYDSLVASNEFVNVLDYRLQTVRQNHVPTLESAVEPMRELIARIDSELRR